MFKLPMLALTAAFVMFAGCSPDQPDVNMEELTSQPKTYVSSETCKNCHLEHYDSWRTTLHSRMTQDARANKDAFVVDLNKETMTKDFQAIAETLKVPVDQIYFPSSDDVLYTIGSQWKQRYIVEREGTLYITPVQYNIETNRFVNYHEQDWLQRPWLLKCGGCHTTGVNMEKQTFTEPGVGCEACHGPGSWHAALPTTALFEKRETIINPSKLTPGIAHQICGSCHNRGSATQMKGAGWPVGYRPGKALSYYYQSTSYEAGDVKHLYANEFSKGHHQQFIDWQQSAHFREGVGCTSCHYVHQLGMPSTRSQTLASGSQQCLTCHTMANQNMAHSIHSFGNCIGCHMPRIAKSAESGDIHSHVFTALVPGDTLKNPKIPNSCQTCHRHKDENLEDLQRRFSRLSTMPAPQGQAIAPVTPSIQ